MRFLKMFKVYRKDLPAGEEKALDDWYDSIDYTVPDLSDEHRSQMEEKLWDKISRVTKKPERTWWQPMMIAAACVLLALGLVYYTVSSRQQSSFPLTYIPVEVFKTLSKIENDSDSNRVVYLTDGSQVTLEPRASLHYPVTFDSARREVYLNGNAFFSIAKDPRKPFLVYSDQIVTKVLGTSFTIRKSAETNEIEVAVMTGKVIVEKSRERSAGFTFTSKSVVLTPNKKVTYTRDAYVTSLVAEPQLIQKPGVGLSQDTFIFDETPLKKVIERLEEAYGVQIDIQNESITGCPVTADLPEVSLFAKLEVIHALLGTRSEIRGTSIVLTGGTCTPFKLLHPNP